MTELWMKISILVAGVMAVPLAFMAIGLTVSELRPKPTPSPDEERLREIAKELSEISRRLTTEASRRRR